MPHRSRDGGDLRVQSPAVVAHDELAGSVVELELGVREGPRYAEGAQGRSGSPDQHGLGRGAANDKARDQDWGAGNRGRVTPGIGNLRGG
jgi:hypothetical protein